MSEGNQTTLRFAISESIWFQKGQEVLEILTVQLTPDVSIQQEGDYIYVRGSLFLEGEYKPVQYEEDDASLRDLSPHRQVEDVFSREDGNNEFYHNFPVDVSIPLSRVNELEDVYVSIESFDYDLVDAGNLNLVADISIGGLCNERKELEEVAPAYEVSQPNPVFQEVAQELQQEEVEELQFEPFRIEVKKDPDLVEEASQNDWNSYAPYQSPFISAYDQQPQQVQSYGAAYENPSYSGYQQAPTPRYDTYEPQVVEQVISPEVYDEQYHPKDENALYLTKLFRNQEDEEGFAQLRMYIVQQGDTLESIAEHYGVKEEVIQRENGLEDNYVSAGKIIYIPQKKKFQL